MQCGCHPSAGKRTAPMIPLASRLDAPTAKVDNAGSCRINHSPDQFLTAESAVLVSPTHTDHSFVSETCVLDNHLSGRGQVLCSSSTLYYWQKCMYPNRYCGELENISLETTCAEGWCVASIDGESESVKLWDLCQTARKWEVKGSQEVSALKPPWRDTHFVHGCFTPNVDAKLSPNKKERKTWIGNVQ